jgi:CubicO group peptidase (beta-lactamase class C family)
VDSTLDWPVEHGGAAVLTANGERFSWRSGTDEARRYPVASVTKLLTSLAALAAVDDGLLGLDDEVDQDPAPEGTTVRHLLAHASGLPFEPGQGLGGRPRPPGERRIYSNLGFQVLAEVLEAATGRGFEDWLGERVLRPLAMTATTIEEGGAHGAGPAAGAVSTLADLALLAGCLLDGGTGVVSAGLMAEAATVQYPGLAGLVPGVGRYDPCDWGLGFELKDGKAGHWMGDARSAASFGHFGASGCFVWVDPEAGVAAAAVSDRPFGDGGWGLATWPAWSDAVAAVDA